MNRILAQIQSAIAVAKVRFIERFGHELVMSDRLKILTAMAGTVLVLAVLLGISGLVKSLERRHVAAQIDLDRLKAQIETSSWQERKQQSQILKSQLDERLWSAETPGLAEAGFERWLRGRLGNRKIEVQQILVQRVPIAPAESGAPPGPLSNIQRMTAKVITPFEQASFGDFLADIAEAEKAMTVDRLIARAGRNPRIEIDVSTFYRLQERRP
jgi:hypothetical protein